VAQRHADHPMFGQPGRGQATRSKLDHGERLCQRRSARNVWHRRGRSNRSVKCGGSRSSTRTRGTS